MLKNIVLKMEYLLIGGVIILIIASYRLAFSKTVEQWHLHAELEAKLADANNVSYQPAYIQRKNANLNNIIRRYKVDTLQFRNNSLNAVSLIAQRYGAALTNVPSQDMQPDTGKVLTEKLVLDGDYFNLLKTTSAIQSTPNIGWLRSISISRPKTVSGTIQEKKLKIELYVEIIK